MEVVLLMRSYIAHPFWDARNRVIEIEKKSGVNRLKNEDKRIAALKAECQKQGISYEDYQRLKVEADEQWYRLPDGRIYIPRHQIAGALVQTIGESPKNLRGPYNKDNFRALVQISDFVTNLTQPSGVFERFVKLEGSNQRSFQKNEYIGVYLEKGQPFEACGTIVVEDPKQAKTVENLLVAAVERVGIGAARKMGFGRGKVLKMESGE